MNVMEKDSLTNWMKVLLYLSPLVVLVGLFFLFNMTNPVDAGPLGIFAVFTLIYIFWLSIIFTLLHGGVAFVVKVSGRKRINLGARKAYYVASVVAFIPVLITGMQSVGQLEIRDIILVFVFVGLAIFYIFKRM